MNEANNKILNEGEQEFGIPPQVHFVVGSGRSGTTLLNIMLEASQSVSSWPEIKLGMNFLEFFPVKTTEVNRLVNRLDSYFSEINEKYEDRKTSFIKHYDVKGIVSQVRSCDWEGKGIDWLYQLVNANLISFGKRNPKAKVLVDKNPLYSFYADQLKRQLPEAKFVFLIRDYRGFVKSNLLSKDRTAKFSSIFHYCFYWNLYVKAYFEMKRKYGADVLLLKFEDLTKDPKLVCKQVVAHFNIPDENLANTYLQDFKDKVKGLDQSVLTPRSIKRFQELIEPINPKVNDDWKEKLTKNQLRITEFLCAKLARKLGYKNYVEQNIFLSVLLFPFTILYGAFVRLLHYFFVKRFYDYPFVLRKRIVKAFNMHNR